MMEAKASIIGESITYHPHKNLRWTVIFMTTALPLFGILLFSSWTDAKTKAFILCLIVATAITCLDTVNLINVSVSLNADGITLQNTFTKYSVMLSWDKLNYGYYVYTAKGHKYLLLSTQRLSPQEQKKLLHQETKTFAQFAKKHNGQKYLCFDLEADSQGTIAKMIQTHVTIEENR